MKLINPLFLLMLLFSACNQQKSASDSDDNSSSKNITVENLTLFDASRNREIPVAVYSPEKNRENAELVVFSHGYGANLGGGNTAYTYLTEFLAAEGYFVVSIQHELPTDSLLPIGGEVRTVRRSNWERGAKNIHFVINEIKNRYPELNYDKITLIGHSNGGDKSCLFPEMFPGVVKKIITLDNRRMPLPRNKKVSVYSLRSSDQPADEGVLPDEQEKKEFGITIVILPDTPHNAMDDTGTKKQKEEINKYVLSFLREQI